MIVKEFDVFFKVVDFDASNVVGKSIFGPATHRSADPVSRAISNVCEGVPIETRAEYEAS